MALARGNNAHGNTSGSSLAVNLSATTDSVIMVGVTTNGGPVTSVTSANGETCTFHGSGPTSGTETFELFSCVVSSTWTSNAVTANTTIGGFLTVDAVEYSGADTANIFDDNASIPDEGNDMPRTVSTDLADTVIIGGCRMNGTSSPTAGTGFDTVSGANFTLFEEKFVTATQSSLSVDVASGTSNGAVATAIREAATATTINAPAASLAYTMLVPTVSTGVAIAAAAATLAYTFHVPTVTAAVNTQIDAPAASLAYTFQVPTVTANPSGVTQIDAPAASLSYTMLVPTVATGVFIDVPAATLAYLMRVPTVNGAAAEAATRGGSSMTLQQMRRLERQQLLAMLREDDDVIVSILSAMGVSSGR